METPGFEQQVLFSAAFDERSHDPRKNYGVHGFEIRLILKGPQGAVDLRINTGWLLPETIGVKPENQGGYPLLDYGKFLCSYYGHGQLSYPSPRDLGYHSPKPRYEGQELATEDCQWVEGGRCYSDASGLQGWEPFDQLLRSGDEVWNWLIRYYTELFGVL